MKFFQISLPDNHQLVLFGDNQEGNIASSHKDLEECIDYIMSTPNCYAAHMGDAVEAYWIDDPRYLPETCTHPPLKQAQYIIKKFLPLVKEGKLITMLMGNHEAALIKKAGDITEFICEELRDKAGTEWPYYGTYSAKVEVMSGKDLQYKFHITHGRRAINSVSPDPRRRRAYMKHTLQRHLEPIFADAVLQGKGHCLSDDTEVLTNKGWKKYNEVSASDKVMTFNKNTDTAEWNDIQQIHIHKNKYDKMLHFRNSVTDILVTEDHNMIVGRYSFKDKNLLPDKNRIIDLPKGVYKRRGRKENEYDVDIRFNHKSIKSGPYSSPEEASEVAIKILKELYPKKNQWKSVKAKDIFTHNHFSIPVTGTSGNKEYPITDDWISLLGWLISEGHFRENGSVQLFQNISSHKQISDLLDRLGIIYRMSVRKFKGRKFNDPRTGKEYETKEDNCAFYIKVKNAKEILTYITNKNIPAYVMQFSDRQVHILLESMMAGDGTWNDGKRSGAYYTSNKKLADDLQIICVTHGIRASINSKSKNNTVNVSLGKTSRKAMSKGETAIREILPSTEIAWCLSVDNGTLFIRREGKVAVVGNTHKLLVAEPEPELYLISSKGKIKQQYTKPSAGKDLYIPPELRYYVNTGSFLKTYEEGVSTYSEIAEYGPVELGYILAEVNDRTMTSVKAIVL